MTDFARFRFVVSNPVVCFWLLSACLIGSAAAAPFAAERQSKNGNSKKTLTAKKPTSKPSPKALAKQIPKDAPERTPKSVVKAAPKSSFKQIQKATTVANQRFITTGFEVNVRENPSVGSKEIAQVRFGTVFRPAERSSQKQTIGRNTDYWYKVVPTGGKSGWVFGAFLREYEPNKREQIYRELAAERLKTQKPSFSQSAELYEFLTRISPDVKTESVAAEIGLMKLTALKSALDDIPFDRQNQEPYKSFIEAQGANVVYSEPAGEWLVRSEMFWNLSQKYKKLPLAEQIAWEAAQNPLPGECEGYLNCYLYFMLATHGEYLKRFPKGAHATESLKALGEMLLPIAADSRKKQMYTQPADVSDRAEFYQTIADLRIIVSKTGFAEKDAVIRQLNQIAEGYR